METAATRSAARGTNAATARTRTATPGARTTAPASPPDLILGRYRLVKPLGSGAFGAVYAGRDERLERDVAVKVLPRERIAGGRFEREARAAARLSHPAIVTLYEAAVDDDGAYLVSELVRGRTLDELLSGGRLSDQEILAIAISLCDALAHAHEQGVIHRDVKPSNVLVPAGALSAAHPAKLTDFGVARIAGGEVLTRTGDVIGTLAYMAPEQTEGRECGPAADLYALAIVTYEALSGVNPLRQLRGTHRPRRLATYLPPLRRQRRDLPRVLGTAIDQALHPRPGERGSVLELRGSLNACLELVGDVRGVVAPGWHGEDSDPEGGEPEPGPEWRQAPETQARPNGSDRATGPQAGGTGARELSTQIPTRALGAAAAGLAAAWLSTHLLSSSPLAPAAAGLIVAAAVLLAPRVCWVTAIAALAVTAALQGHGGAALLLVLVAAISAGLMAPFGRTWSLPAGGAVAALLGVAGVWPAVAARAGHSVWQRAILGGTGFLWLAAVAPLIPGRLFLTVPVLPRPSVWGGSVADTLHHVLAVLLSSGAPAAAAVWAAAAAVAPWLVRDRRPLWNLIAVTVWSATCVAAVHGFGPRDLSGVVLGTVLGAVILLMPSLPALLGLARKQLAY